MEKRKKRPARFSQLGCVFLLIGLPVLACGLCYASMWLFARFGGEWSTSGSVFPLSGSTLIETARFGGRIRYVQRLYAVNGKLEDFEAPESYRIIRDGQMLVCDYALTCTEDENYLGLFVLFFMSWNVTHSQQTGFVYDIGPHCEFARLYDTHSHFYNENREHFNSADYHFPENALALLTQTCYYAID